MEMFYNSSNGNIYLSCVLTGNKDIKGPLNKRNRQQSHHLHYHATGLIRLNVF